MVDGNKKYSQEDDFKFLEEDQVFVNFIIIPGKILLNKINDVFNVENFIESCFEDNCN
jgi:hypothetical protein